MSGGSGPRAAAHQRVRGRCHVIATANVQRGDRWTSRFLQPPGGNVIEFRALGPLAVVIDGAEASIGGPRQRRLLAMLLVHHGDVVSVDRLADAVFDGEPTEAARTTMRSYIARIRKVIAAGAPDVELVTRAPGYGLVGPRTGFD